ncbi:MAG: 23S rRNA pseudouridine(955/2504/2580) synthase RluC [Porticoccaceae bacterium]|nr:MAG: 23S rRNA pseudouridine(955/2504/2580) synthase RluC [Porticoccaceae bacterium]
MSNNQVKPPSVYFVEVTSDYAGQRVDNFLLARLKGVPKSRIYRIIRKGEVRVNRSRVKPEYKLVEGDQVRIPPVRVAEREAPIAPGQKLQELLEDSIIYEDGLLLVINKPSGLAVHGGSGVSLGLIEAFRATRPKQPFLELVHRLDRETSGCLIIAKKRSALRFLQDEMRARRVVKVYQALTSGRWPRGMKRIDMPLLKSELKSGERIVRVNPEGKRSVTHFSVLQRFNNATLVEVTLETGRTHQIRVHAQYAGCPLAGDEKYGDDQYNRNVKTLGLKRMFLHALKLQFNSPGGEKIRVEAPIPKELSQILTKLES